MMRMRMFHTCRDYYWKMQTCQLLLLQSSPTYLILVQTTKDSQISISRILIGGMLKMNVIGKSTELSHFYIYNSLVLSRSLSPVAQTLEQYLDFNRFVK